MKIPAKRQQTLMSKKYFSMLLGGTLTMMVVSLLLMSDSVIISVGDSNASLGKFDINDVNCKWNFRQY